MIIDGKHVSNDEVKAVIDHLAIEANKHTTLLRTYHMSMTDALAAIFDNDPQAAITYLQDALKTPRTFVTRQEAIPMLLQKQAS